ncbi:MAG: DUF374 domain-containing protein [Gemmatimonadetes bacterium]|nr:DUF374 domain-containing protein [Gemmatimonadota bacterium]
MAFFRTLVAWLGAIVLTAINWTLRIKFHNDPRAALKASSRGYIYAILHAHQLTAGMNHGEKACAAMVSRSADGDLLIPLCRLHRITPVRGSSQKKGKNKGGRGALAELIDFVSANKPCTMAVDGPRGPRGVVKAGVVEIAQATGALILPVVAVPSGRWVLSRTWDRFQIPKPFARVVFAFGAPITADNSSSPHELCLQVSRSLADLERLHDPDESKIHSEAAESIGLIRAAPPSRSRSEISDRPR